MKKKKIIISEILFGICSMILLLIFGNYLCAKQFQYKINGKHYLQIINDGFSDEEKVLTHTDNLKKTYEMLSNTKYPYLEYSQQNLEYIGNYSMDENFVNGGKECVNQKVNNCTISPLKAMGVGMKTFDYVGMEEKIEEGNGFSKSDFEYNDNKTIPLLLGNKYKEYFAIGDEIEVFYLGEEKIKGEVIGFFALNQSIDEMSYELDYSIIFPLQNIEDLKKAKPSFVQKLYTIKTEGDFVYCNKKQYYDEISLIENIKRENNIELGYVENLQVVPNGEKYKMNFPVAIALNVFGILIMFGACLAVWYSTLTNMEKNSMLQVMKPVGYLIIFNFILYQFVYKIVLEICRNNTLKLNIMRQKEFALEIIGLDAVIALAIILIIHARRRRKINGSNRSN